MLILVIIISLLLIIFSINKLENCGMLHEDFFETIGGVFAFILLVSVASLIILLFIYPYNVDEKLKMYQEENESIEQKIRTTVQNYKEYEQETFSKIVENADLQTLILKFPELNSNELVKSEIETYKSNNEKIKSLKEQQIDKGRIGWWLFFNIGG